jgi:hypothetical protein
MNGDTRFRSSSEPLCFDELTIAHGNPIHPTRAGALVEAH